MMTLPLAHARAELSRLIDEATTTRDRFDIARNGHRAAVLLSADDYDTCRTRSRYFPTPNCLLLTAPAAPRSMQATTSTPSSWPPP